MVSSSAGFEFCGVKKDDSSYEKEMTIGISLRCGVALKPEAKKPKWRGKNTGLRLDVGSSA